MPAPFLSGGDRRDQGGDREALVLKPFLFLRFQRQRVVIPGGGCVY